MHAPDKSLPASLAEQFTKLPILLNPGDCVGKTYIVTGSNIGLGFETAKHLVRCTASRVVLGVRNVKAGQEAKTQIESSTKRAGVMEVWHLDLGSSTSVKEFANRAVSDLERLDALVLNAAVALDKWTTVEGGLETCLAVNAIHTMYLAVRLLPKLMESSRQYSLNPRLTFVVTNLAFTAQGELAKSTKAGDNILDGVNDAKRSDPTARYAVTKLVEMFAIRQMAEVFPFKKTGVVINMVTPGLCSTGLARDTRSLYKMFLNLTRSVVARTAEEGSRTILHAIGAKEESHGKLLSGCKIKDYWLPDWVKVDDGKRVQKQIWDEITAQVDILEPHCVDGII